MTTVMVYMVDSAGDTARTEFVAADVATLVLSLFHDPGAFQDFPWRSKSASIGCVDLAILGSEETVPVSDELTLEPEL